MAWRGFGPLGLIKQMDGSQYGALNCNCATAAMMAVSDRRGIRPSRGAPWHPTGASVRYATGDRSGGTTLMQTDAALYRVYGLDMDVRIVPFATAVQKIALGFPAIILVSYGPISRAGFSGSPGFVGNHSLFFSAASPGSLLDHDPLYDGRRAGIPKGPKWLPQSLIRAAAGSLIMNPATGRTLNQDRGYGMAYCAFGLRAYNPAPAPPLPDTSTTAITYRYGGGPYWRGVYRVDVQSARLRRSPYIKSDNVVRTVMRGATFRCRQTTTKGSVVRWQENGTGAWRQSGKWHGDGTGTLWMHESVLDPT